MLSLGLDIGGANTKAVLFEDSELDDYWLEHIPLWKNWENLREFLKKLENVSNPQKVGITMTGELSDVFESKREGVKKIVNTVEEIFSSDVYYLNLEGNLVSGKKAYSSPYKLSASNWVSSALLVGSKYPNCLVIDAGSTTTDIIRVEDKKPKPEGWTDLERLQTGELVYTGVLRTPAPYLKSKLSINGKSFGIAAEYFANMADVYRTLDFLEVEDYTCETPDGRGKNKKECMQRLARLFCSDVEEVGEGLIIKAAEEFRDAQISKIMDGIERVKQIHNISKTLPIIVTGIGGEILAKEAAKQVGFENIINLRNIYNEVAAEMTPAYSLGLLVKEEANP
ncbi:hypothetical protein AKJ52_00225 [candidate division MSBL1 archaeon SCGC-AAA382C18]|uniref:Hydantoinase A/oxoprolinase domain-containing protein n=1 Tax=candidate division MSBL1 archaeon SCGC-AAA382C18 TaxID=1698281 RepID=A0A133VLX2_9EURY|nr:hypothetical protein AKJ52_00225 [candidate division MSBL1 archaeon SCGC-AAA382C18]